MAFGLSVRIAAVLLVCLWQGTRSKYLAMEACSVKICQLNDCECMHGLSIAAYMHISAMHTHT